MADAVADGGTNPFSPRIVAAVVLAGIAAFLGFLLLTAYAPQLRMRSAGGATPLSKSAVGFYGLYRLAELSGRPVDLNQTPAAWSTGGFVIVTIDTETDANKLRALVAARRAVANSRTLYILPKWAVAPLPANRRWVQGAGTLPADWAPAILEIFGRIKFAEAATGGAQVHGVADGELAGVFGPAPRTPHYIATGMKPVLHDDYGHTLLGRTDFNNDAAEYILADPDVVSNQGLKTEAAARAALQIVDAMRADANDSVAFDLALNGMNGSRNLLQLMFEPPFLALTLAVLAAALLIGIHAFSRFGPPVAEARAIPFGKRALADNTAMLIGRAGAVRRLGDRYVAIVRDSVAAALGAATLDADAQERWLGSLPNQSENFATLAAAARTAASGEAMRIAALDLDKWRKEMTRDR